MQASASIVDSKVIGQAPVPRAIPRVRRTTRAAGEEAGRRRAEAAAATMMVRVPLDLRHKC